MTGTLEDVVGLHEAAGFINTVAQRMGEQLNEAYRQSLNLHKLDRQQVCKVIADLEKRINGSARIVHEDEEKIVLQGCVCPFGQDVQDRPSMCMMVTNMIGVIAAQNLGYAKVSVEEAQSQGDSNCHVTVYLVKNAAAEASDGREHFQS
jgi:predicted ArsR family transcriptional regulator